MDGAEAVARVQRRINVVRQLAGIDTLPTPAVRASLLAAFELCHILPTHIYSAGSIQGRGEVLSLAADLVVPERVDPNFRRDAIPLCIVCASSRQHCRPGAMFQLLLHPALVCIALLSLATMCRGELEALKAAEISREIRQQFRISGMNWVSPKMLREVGESCVGG